MKNLQNMLLLGLVLCSLNSLSSCALPPRPAIAMQRYQRPPQHMQPPRVIVPGHPIQIGLPPAPNIPAININIHENCDVTTDGPAKIKRLPSGMEIQQVPRQSRPIDPFPYPDPISTPGASYDPPGSQLPAPATKGSTDTQPWLRLDGRELAFRAVIVLGVGLLAVLIIALIKFRNPVAETVKNADLSDGITDEAKELYQRIMQQINDDKAAKASPPDEDPPAKPAAKKTTAKK